MGSILSRLFFRVIWKYGILERISDVHSMGFDWIHCVTWLIRTEVKLLLCTSKGKLNQKSNGPPSYSFSFDPPHTHETNGLTMEHNI